MVKDLKIFFWALKLGALFNLWLLGQTLITPLVFVDVHILIPAQIFFIVSAFRCFFPVSYATNAVLHDSFLSSIFLTRLFATFSEVAYIYQFSYLIRLFNANQIPSIDILSWLMVVQVIISQYFVWSAIITGKLKRYFYEELGWLVIFFINTSASAILFWTLDNLGEHVLLLQLNLLFGAVYLPWQYIHLKSLRLRAKQQEIKEDLPTSITWTALIQGLHQSIQLKKLTTLTEYWGGTIGMIWMTAYWATLIPLWIYLIVRTV